MKYIILVPDGMADEPLKELGGKTPLEAAHTPFMDTMAKNGFIGLVQTIPDGLPPGSDIGNLALLGYDPEQNYTGRAPLEAASMKINLADDELAFRCNMVTIKDDVMVDYSAGHITTKEADQLIVALNQNLAGSEIKFYTGKSYRHIMVIKTKHKEKLLKIKCVPPHDIIDKNVKDFLPSGDGCEAVINLMDASRGIFAKHKTAASQIWLWGQGGRPKLELFEKRYGFRGSIISAVDLVTGIGYLTGLEVVNVPGATGYYDTNYKGKAQYALASLKEKDFVYVHVEAPDEAGHNGDYKEKVKAIENIDREIVGALLKWSGARNDVRILIAPDHPTPVAKRTHTRAPVCFVMTGAGIAANGKSSFSEKKAAEVGLKFKSGQDLIRHFLKK